MQRVDSFSCCKIVLFSTPSNCWSHLFGCFKKIRTWQFSNGPLAQSLCEPERASRRITPIGLRKSSNSVVAAFDLFAACQQYTSMEI